MIGSSIGNYVVRAKIGEGGMGIVYLAEHPRIGRRVAIKVLHPEHGQDPRAIARFFTEAKAAYEVRNEHIVEILDFGELPDGSPYFVMEWLDGRTLATVLSSEPSLPIERVLHITLGIAEALAAAHDGGIVHRDLKPGNIVLVERGDDPDFVKVVDFGVAKLLSGREWSPELRTTARTVLGTWAYMAPEQCQGENDRVDARSDIYSLGIVLYEMATGRLPFLTEGTGMLLAHISRRPPPPRTLVPGLPEAFEAVILRALEKEPEKRFQSVGELVVALTGMPLPARKARPVTPFPAAPAPESPRPAIVHVSAPGNITAPLWPQGATPRTPPKNLAGDIIPPLPSPFPDQVDQVDQVGENAPSTPARRSGPVEATAAPPGAGSSLNTPSGGAVPLRSSWRGVLLGGAVILAVAVLAGPLVARRYWPAPASTTPPPPARPVITPPPAPAPSPPPVVSGPPLPAAAVRLMIHTVPPTARLALDGAELANPFSGTFPRGDTRHLLVAELHQHRKQSRWVVFDRDQEVTLVLQPLPAGSRSPSRPAAQTPESPPVTSEPPSGPERGKRNKPKIITNFPE